VQHPQARYELDWKTPEQLLVAAVLADGSRDAAVNDVTKVLFEDGPASQTQPVTVTSAPYPARAG
jgi:endonuclease-3